MTRHDEHTHEFKVVDTFTLPIVKKCQKEAIEYNREKVVYESIRRNNINRILNLLIKERLHIWIFKYEIDFFH